MKLYIVVEIDDFTEPFSLVADSQQKALLELEEALTDLHGGDRVGVPHFEGEHIRVKWRDDLEQEFEVIASKQEHVYGLNKAAKIQAA